MEVVQVPAVKPVPRHIAILMDGNRRWANQRHMPKAFGHASGARRVRSVVHAESCWVYVKIRASLFPACVAGYKNQSNLITGKKRHDLTQRHHPRRRLGQPSAPGHPGHQQATSAGV
ncbi:MAG: undecaprenyl diphosphate synthase family protein [Polaromonas sp.]|nr:undecaprenyl diphosphate synthase family protein [Polaromonas sp.]